MTDQIRTVTLENLEPRMVCYNLDHKHAVARMFPRVTELANGQAHGDFVELKLPDSVTFLAKEKRSLPASILECDEIRSALEGLNGVKRLRKLGDIVVHETASPAVGNVPAADGNAPAEAVNAAAKKNRDAARSVVGTKALVEENKD